MEPKIIEFSKKTIAGYALKTSGCATTEVPAFWEAILADGRHKALHDADFIASCTDYGVMLDGEGDEYGYVVGCEIKEGVSVPEGFFICEIPGGTYAALETPLAKIGPTWGDIYEWANTNQYKAKDSAFELYDERMENEIAEVWLQIEKL